MGDFDSYWKERANNFIKKHHVPKKDYDEHIKYFDEYCELRDRLLNDLGLYEYIDDDLSIDEIPEHGFVEGEIVTNPKNFQSGYSYTVVRVKDFGRCAELHYNNGEATVEYGYKINHDYWKNETENAEWFKKDMSEEEIISKIFSLFNEHYNLEKLQSFSYIEDVDKEGQLNNEL